MPIGKNAIKRVENNGYSKVKTEAPDMENSNVIIAKPDEQVVEKLIAPVEKATAKKAAAKKPSAAAAKKAPAKKPAAKKTAAPAKNAFERVSFGEDMPYYLL